MDASNLKFFRKVVVLVVFSLSVSCLHCFPANDSDGKYLQAGSTNLGYVNNMQLDENDKDKDNEVKEGEAVSIIKFVPGVYQLSKKKILKGGVLFGAFTAALIGAIIENNKGNELYDKYLASTDVEEIVELRKQTEQRFRNRNYFFAGVLAVWLIHMVDLKIYQHKNKKGGVKGEIQKDQIQVSLYYSF